MYLSWVTYAIPTECTAEYDLGSVTASYDAGGESYRVTIEKSARVACVQNEATYIAGVDKEAWERSVVEEAYGQLRESVARDVKEGRREAAQAKIEAYRAQQAWMNERLESELVEWNLAEVQKLEADMDDAFRGADQADKRNRFSKTTQSEANAMRRSGSKK